jgi:bifunctional ADP-heptose synthase (sugar kinase/adenylyltransferase)
MKEWLDKVSDLKVLMVGDSIIDEYHYVQPMGKASKENLIATKFERKDTFPGGVWAAAAHVENFCREVVIYSGNKTTVKRRFVDETYTRKLFEVHYDRLAVGQSLPDAKDFDLVIVTDFGHGCVKKGVIERLTKEAKFFAVNAQTNSANYGFNLITKYTRADYVVLDELEGRLAARDRDTPIEKIIGKLGFPKIVVTQGPNGCTGFDGRFHHEPSMANKVVDLMGAGDAFFCVTAPLASVGAPIEVLCKVGNAAGAIKIESVGQKAVTKEALLERL